jgi:hypothetical protein
VVGNNGTGVKNHIEHIERIANIEHIEKREHITQTEREDTSRLIFKGYRAHRTHR